MRKNQGDGSGKTKGKAGKDSHIDKKYRKWYNKKHVTLILALPLS